VALTKLGRLFLIFDLGSLVDGVHRCVPAVPWTKQENKGRVWRSLSTPDPGGIRTRLNELCLNIIIMETKLKLMLLAGLSRSAIWLCQWGPISLPRLGRSGLRLQGAIGQIGSRDGRTYYKLVWGVDSLAVKWTESGEGHSDLRTVCWMRTKP